MMGPPGAQRYESCEALGEYFEWDRIHTGKLIREQVTKQGPHAARVD